MRSNVFTDQHVDEVELEMESCINNSYIETVPDQEKDLVKAGICIKND